MSTIKPDPTAILRYNDPRRPRTLEEQVEYAFLRLLEALDKHISDLSSLRESMPEEDDADLIGGIVADLVTITSRNTALRCKLNHVILDRLQGFSPTIKP
jgi:hypothetical protein